MTRHSESSLKKMAHCRWIVPIGVNIHIVTYEQNTKNGKSTLKVDEKVYYSDTPKWSASEKFSIEKTTCEIITKKTSNELVYSLKVDNKPFEEFRNSQYKEFERWEVSFKGEGKFNIVLDKGLNVFIDGKKVKTERDFTDRNAVATFEFGTHKGQLTSYSSGNQIEHRLTVDGETHPRFIDGLDGVHVLFGDTRHISL
ncbi:hypothetical protein GCK72_011254 [Caenorhabditis remanei]|uniref:Uncharacterized protein n=1 Tax=Caenorhabditis remanei TaxID=31234 RepID=A0A6A5H7G5_CAERE|nr:hypothetical protein GCK72_011254 [Caenorhabditis remanei]KAF1762989.1 hypothetical protein GCK72_011254 [Caenorhabditis remanei]